MILTNSTVIEFLKLESTDSARIDAIIAWAQARAELIIGRSLESVERVDYLNGNHSHKIILPIIPVTEIVSISLDSGRDFTDLIADNDYYLDPTMGIIHLYSHLTPVGYATVKVVYTAGYTENTLPADIKMALIECISWNYKRLIDSALGISSHNTPDGVSVGYEMVLPLGAQRVFESHRDVRC